MSKQDVETYRHGWRKMSIDKRVGVKRARRFLEDGAPNLSYDITGQEPCAFTEGETIIIDPLNLWITISSIKPRSGQWKIQYVLADHRPAYMGKKMGFTDDPSKAMRVNFVNPDEERFDEPEGIKDIEAHPQRERELAEKRKHMIDLEMLVMERDAHRKRLLSTSSEISQRLLPRMIEKLDRQIEELQRKERKSAA